MVNEKIESDSERSGSRLEDYAEENSIGHARFLAYQLKPFQNMIELTSSETQLIAFTAFAMSLSKQ